MLFESNFNKLVKSEPKLDAVLFCTPIKLIVKSYPLHHRLIGNFIQNCAKTSQINPNNALKCYKIDRNLSF